jgi:hypothetical protein
MHNKENVKKGYIWTLWANNTIIKTLDLYIKKAINELALKIKLYIKILKIMKRNSRKYASNWIEIKLIQ